MEYYSALKKEEHPATCNNMNESRGHYAMRIKPDRKKQILHGITYMWNLKNKR